jgi:hypothetical protein
VRNPESPNDAVPAKQWLPKPSPFPFPSIIPASTDTHKLGSCSSCNCIDRHRPLNTRCCKWGLTSGSFASLTCRPRSRSAHLAGHFGLPTSKHDLSSSKGLLGQIGRVVLPGLSTLMIETNGRLSSDRKSSITKTCHCSSLLALNCCYHLSRVLRSTKLKIPDTLPRACIQLAICDRYRDTSSNQC